MVRTLEILTLELEDIERATPDLEWRQVGLDFELPSETGVYVMLDADNRVLYIGMGGGTIGLRGRIALHKGKRREADLEDSLKSLRRTFRGVLSGLSERGALLAFALTSEPAKTESMLLAFAVQLTGLQPPLNGQGWDWTDATIAGSNDAATIFDRLYPEWDERRPMRR